jgi:methylmalonyl-CoA/ethylmalonyl-CoA epimerase
MRLHHFGVAVPSIEQAAAQYRQAFGISLSTGIVADELQKVRVAFAPVGDGVFVEFVEPIGEDSPIQGVLRKGGGLYHVCYVVADIDAAIEQLRLSGGRTVSPPQPARAFDGRRIAFVYTQDRSLVEFLEQ